MATDLERLVVTLSADIKSYEKALARASNTTTTRMRKMEREARTFQQRFDKSLGAVGSGLKGFAAGFFGAAGISTLARAAQTAIKHIADIGDAADKLGLSTDDFQELAFAAKLAGVETDAFATGMKKLAVNSSEAARGQGKLGEIFKLNNVNIKDANGNLLDQTQILARVADLVKNATSEQDKAAIAVAAFGKSGVDLLNLLQGGAEAVVKAMAVASEEGVKFSEAQIRKAQEFDDRLDIVIEKISVGLKGSFLDAAVGAEDFAARAVAALDSIGIKSISLGELISNSLRTNPMTAATAIAFDKLRQRGRGLGGPVPIDPSVSATLQASTGGAVKGSLRSGTLLPPDPEDTAELERQGEAIQEVIAALRFEAEQIKRTEVEQQVQTEIRKAGVSASSAEGKEIRKLVEANYAYAESQKTVSDTQKQIISQTEDTTEAALRQREAFTESLRALAELGLDAFERVAFGGEKLKDVLNEVIKSLASAALQAAILGQGPLAGFLGGGGGLLGGLLGGGGIASLYHKGGVVGQSGASTRRIPASTFAGAERFHSGGMPGIRPGEVPAILQRGETVLPRGSKGGAFSLNFAPVIDARGADAAAVGRLQVQLDTMAKNMGENVRSIVQKEKFRNPRFLNS